MRIIRRAKNYVKANGIRKSVLRLFQKANEKIINSKKSVIEQESYLEWIKNNEPTQDELEAQRNHKFKYLPLISVIVPMYNTKERYFKELVDSLKSQTYENFELCLADGSEQKSEFIDRIIDNDTRIKYRKLEKNTGISGNSNEALSMATGDYIALLDHDDIIPSFSLYEIVKTINENMDVEFIYTDEDKLLEYKDKRMGPHFKSDFALDTFRSYNYICHFSIFKRELIDRIGGFRSKYDGSQDYDIIFRAIEEANKIVHIPKILYHWRINENSVASGAAAKPYAYVAAKEAIRENIKKHGIKAEVTDSKILGLYRVKYLFDGNPKVSIIIPNKDHKKDLKKCIKSILKSTYKNYEIIIVENNSNSKDIFKYYDYLKKNYNVRVVTLNQNEFNYSKLNNFGVRNSNGEYLLFLNNDIKILSEDFLETLIGDASREDIGAVGAKLLYPDNTIQHAGIVLNFTGVAGHVNANLKDYDVGYMGRTMIQQNFNAITGALMMMKKKDFDEVGGFDESFPVAYNDVDICLSLRKLGKLNLYEPYVKACHYESRTRGYDDTDEKKKRLLDDAKKLKEKWKDFFDKGDKYFNINFRDDTPDMRIRKDRVKEI